MPPLRTISRGDEARSSVAPVAYPIEEGAAGLRCAIPLKLEVSGSEGAIGGEEGAVRRGLASGYLLLGIASFSLPHRIK